MMEGIAEKALVSLTYGNFGKISDYINEERDSNEVYITEDYLYKNVYRQIIRCEKVGEDTLALNRSFVNRIMNRLGFKSIEEFKKLIDNPIDPILSGCLGNWYSYVRRNTEKLELLRSPVSIYISGNEVCIKLVGPINQFNGKIKISGGCLFCHMYAKAGKELHHVYKIGIRQTPELLQGVFSGASSGGEPIGGRVILIREDQEFDQMSARKLQIELEDKITDPITEKLASYFKTLSKNNLRIERAETFDLDDL